VTLTPEKAQEFKAIFSDGKVPVSSTMPSYDEKTNESYFHFDLSALSEKQRKFLVELGRSRGAPLEMRDEDILASAAIKREDTVCSECGAREGEACKAYDYEHECPYYVPSEEEMERADEEWAEENGDEDDFFEDEEQDDVLFDSGLMGSQLEAQLLQFKEANQCRQCGKIEESLRNKKVEERFCCEECSKKWHQLMEIRLEVGKRDLESRGYD
jgi:ribosomal protein L40E